MPSALRGSRVVSVRDGVLSADSTIPTSDFQFSASEVPEDLSTAIDGLSLCGKVRTGSSGVPSCDVPTAGRVGLDDATFRFRHEIKYGSRTGG